MKKNNILSIVIFTAVMSVSSFAFSQVKIGDNPSAIDGSAVMELESTNKGFLPTRIALTNSTDVVTIPSPANGLLVFNTSTNADITPGMYYFFNGNWKRVESSNSGSGNNASSQNAAFVGPYLDQVSDGVKIGNYSFRLKRRTGATTYTTSTENIDSQIMYSGPNPSEQIAGFASTMYNNNQYDFSGLNLAAPTSNPTGATTRTNSLLNKDLWYGIGEVGFVTTANNLEKRQYVLTPLDPAKKNFFRIEFSIIDPTPTCGTCNASNPSENDSKVIIFVEYLNAN